MPLRPVSLAKTLSFTELPILEFLAPRVFKPWPKGLRNRKTYTTIQAGEEKATRLFLDRDSPHNVKHGRETSFGRELETLNVEVPATIKHPGTVVDQSFGGSVTYGSERSDSQPTGSWESGALTELPLSKVDQVPHGHGGFRNAYQNVWGSAPSLKPPRVAHNHAGVRPVSHEGAERLTEASTRWRERRTIRGLADRNIPCVRTKYIRSTPNGDSGLDVFSSSWSTDFTKLSRRFDGQLCKHKVPDTLRIRLAKQLVGRESIVQALDTASGEAFIAEWRALHTQERIALWPQIMLNALRKNPKSALKFLVTTCFEPLPPSYALSDSLEYIVCYYLYRVDNPATEDIDTLFRSIVQLLDHLEGGYLHLSQKTIFWLLSHLSTEQAEQFYTILNQHGQPIHENTLLNLMDKFARKGRTELAVEVLTKVSENGADFTKPQIESVCATLLQRRYRTSSDTMLSDSDIFATMLDLGLQPNIIFYNILLQNAIFAGDSDTPWQIHDMMLEIGINPDAYTYSILLNDAKLREDRPTVERILDIVKSSSITNEYIITDLLHAIFFLHEQDRRAGGVALNGRPFDHMLPLYNEYFDLEPLRHLMPEVYQDLIAPFDSIKMHPSKETLVVMLIALLRGFTNPNITPAWYEQFRKLVLDGHPDVMPLAESTHIYDAVIMSLGRWPGTLHLCTKVISDMFASYGENQNIDVQQADASPLSGDAVASSEQEELFTDSPFKHCQPSVRTWSILVKIFMDHQQPRAAEKVLSMMRSRGIAPNQVTWNSLAVGYARMQDISGTVNTIERLEHEGWVVDDVTMKGLQWIENQGALTQALQQKDSRRVGGLPSAENQRLEENVEEIIDTAGQVYQQEEDALRRTRESDRRLRKRLRKPLQPLNFGPGELVFPPKASHEAAG
jgi:pentatricopeptide repeat protein